LVHLQIKQQNVAGIGSQCGLQAAGLFDFSDHFYTLRHQQRAETLPEQSMVIGNYQT